MRLYRDDDLQGRAPGSTHGCVHRFNLPHNMPAKNTANWFEIAVADFDRASRFYSTILQVPMTEVPSTGNRMAMFPYDPGQAIGGSLSLMEEFKPGPGGTMVYLNVEGDIDGVLSRIPAAGGSVIRPRFGIGEHGFIAVFRDSEGNVVGLHSTRLDVASATAP